MAVQSSQAAIGTRFVVSIAALELWFRDRLDNPGARIAGMEPLAGGLSNETLLVRVLLSDDSERRFVLRWDPGDGVMAPYDMALQFNLFRALRGTQVPVPQTYWLETDRSVIGRDFWAIEYVDGETPGRLLEPGTPARFSAFIGALASIHNVDWRAIKLDGILPLPDALPGRSAIDRVEKQRHAIAHPDDAALFSRARSWLIERVPARREVSLVHGDCSLSNYLFRGDKVVAVLDWELAALSDPLQDVGYYCTLIFRYRTKASEDDRERERSQFLEAYQLATKRPFEDLAFWEAVAAYRNGVLSSHPLYAAYATDHYKNRLTALIA